MVEVCYLFLNDLYYYFMSNFVAKQRNRNDTYAYLYANVCGYNLLKWVPNIYAFYINRLYLM